MDFKNGFKDTYGVLQLAAKQENSAVSRASVIVKRSSCWWKKFKAIFSLVPKKNEEKTSNDNLSTGS